MSFNIWTFLFEAVNFVVLAFVLHRLLYEPLRRAVAERQEANARAQAEAQKASEAAAALQLRLQDERAALEKEREAVLREAHTRAEGERKRLLEEATALAQRRRDEAHQALDAERAEALEALRGEVVGQALDLARRLLGEATERTLQQQLALRLVETLGGLSEVEREHVRGHWQPEDGAVLETAQELDRTALEQINAAVAAVLGRATAVAVQVWPALTGGVRLRIGGHVWDASVAGQMEGAGWKGLEKVQSCPTARGC
jgi:F-type H+-transporting ATPase subunit b